MRLATRRLTEASAHLAADDRALLSLLTHHGLDDGVIAQVLHIAEREVAARRRRLVARLAAVLDLPTDLVRRELDEQSREAREARAAARVPAHGKVVGTADGTLRAAPQSRPQRRGTRAFVLLALAGVAVVGLIAVVLAVISSNDTTRPRPQSLRRRPAARAALSAHGTLATLPGPRRPATGTFAVSGTATQPELTVTVSHLRRHAGGHFELWLYSSVIDSTPLAAVSAPTARATVRLPADYRRYRWLDVSYQPPGAVAHSGESVLRAPVPG